MKRILALLLVVTLFMTLMPAGMAEEMATESVYKTYFSSEYPSLNYYATIYGGVRGLAANSVEALVEPDQYGVYQPAMAESWTHNEDTARYGRSSCAKAWNGWIIREIRPAVP